jgi:CheY-like chemotaxis protein
MNGFEATRIIKKTKPFVPIVAQTSYTGIEEKEKALSVGCDDFISKPINEKEFYGVLYKYLKTG